MTGKQKVSTTTSQPRKIAMKHMLTTSTILLLLAAPGAPAQIRPVDVIYPPIMIGPAKVPPAPAHVGEGSVPLLAENQQGDMRKGRRVRTAELDDCVDSSENAGYSFDLEQVVSCEDTTVDVYLSYTPADGHHFLVPDDTDIKDLGSFSSVTRVPGFSPTNWAPDHGVLLMAGHVYVVWTSGGDFCLVRVTVLRERHASIEWVWHSNLSRARVAASEKKREEQEQRRKDLGPYFGR